MLLVDLKNMAERERGGAPVAGCVLSVPGYYTQAERRAMLAAAQVGGYMARKRACGRERW